MKKQKAGIITCEIFLILVLKALNAFVPNPSLFALTLSPYTDFNLSVMGSLSLPIIQADDVDKLLWKVRPALITHKSV